MRDDDEMTGRPDFTPGRVTYGVLYRLLAWEKEQGLARITKEQLTAYQDEGFSPAQAGLDLGLIDYGEASGWVE